MPLSPTPVINAIDAVSSISQSGFDMNWPPTNGATGYRVYVSADGFISTLPGYDNLLVNDTLLSVSGLQAGTTYSFKLASENNSGISPTSEIITITTIPGTPFALAGSEETPVSFTANWQTVNGADYYQIDISTAEDFSSFIPGWQDSTVTNTSIGVEGLNEGTKYYYRVRSGNGSGVSPPSNSIAVTTDISLTPLAYNMGNYNTSLTSGGSTNITLDISGGLSPYTAKISYSQLASNEMTIADIPQNTTTGNFEFPVTYDMLDAVGLSFTVEVTDAAGSKKNSNEHTIYTAFGENQYNIPFTRFGGKEEDWTMFSIPFKLNGTGNSVAKLFNETIGQSTDRNWRLVRWNNNNKKYADQSSNIEEGKGYFFNSKKDVGDKIKLGAGQSNEAPFTLSLEKGWNQVGNPYNIPISWEAVRQAGGNPDIGPLMVYTPDGAASFTQGDIINPFEAGFVEAKNAGTVEIHPATAQSGGRFGLNEISNRDINQEEWRVPLSVLSGNKSSNIGAFGMHPEATTSNDRYDQLVVPRFMRYTEIYTRHEEEHYPLFAQDITTTQNTHTWRFTFESNILTGLVTLTWPK
ncbi:MAG: fibronectin type III domain-containing protein, partial [Cyclobacteriaceae bacterium]|nr:fibronectin type III domain-containing protein [Cyclobacteriaceae bacterium]